ncbi:MAG: outer membrane protein assembly factor BamB family protein [Rhodospirillales bacterium]
MTAAPRRAQKTAKAAKAAKAVSVLAFTAALSACGGIMDSWFGEAEAPPLPGDRIAVLLHESTVSADPELGEARILLPAPSLNKEWPQAGGYANHAMHHIKINSSLSEAWSADIGNEADDENPYASEPVIARGRVFVMDAESVVSAYRAKTGDFLWETELTPEEEDDGHVGGGVAVDNGLVFASTGFGHVIAMSLKTGQIKWRVTELPPMRTAPTVRGGRVFVITIDNALIALNAETGEELWRHEAIAEAANILGGASPAEDEGVVIAPYSSGELAALRVDTGRVLWTESLAASRRTDVVSALSHIRGRPIIDRGMVFAVSHSGLMAAFELRSGRRVWERRIGGYNHPWIVGDYIYLLTPEGEIVCLAREDGRIYWVRGLPRFEDEEDKEDPIVWSGPIVASDRLIIAGSHGWAWALSPYTGDLLGVVEMPDGVSVPPVVANGAVYFLANNAELVAYR